ncbi:hypothetical protein [Streptomyces sp. NPDC057910]|uniref:hypothetical protein n=1 Tax=Streptomyces sp. NPDC057910 TaxID=3346278 RepID=UPI0036E5C167
MLHIPRTGEGATMVGMIALTALELAAVDTVPAPDRPLVSGVLLGAGAAIFLLAATVLHRHRTAARRARQQLIDSGDWFTARTLEGFPMEAIRPHLLGPDAPSLNRLYTAWVLATHGHSAAWIQRNLDLPSGLVRLLVDAATTRR